MIYDYVARFFRVDTERLKMGKIVKFCSSCEEGFAEKFGFCPNCGQTLQTFELNPIVAAAPPVPQPPIAAPVVAASVVEPVVAAPIAEPVVSAPVAVEPVKYFEPRFVEEPVIEEAFVAAEPVPPAFIAPEPVLIEPAVAQAIEEPIVALPPVVAAPVAPATAAFATPKNTYIRKPAVNVDRKPVSLEAEHKAYADDGGFYVTVIEEKNVGQRRALLVGALGLVLFVLTGGMVYNLFSKDLDVGSINDDIFNAVIVDTEPMTIEQEKQQKKEKDAGGGGGGGRDEKEEVTKGDLADQAKNPTRPPDAKVFRSDNFDLKMPPPQTEGPPKTYDKKNDRWGDPNGRFASFSNGTGTGGGQGSGTGTGQGSGRGTGNGSGTGSGSGGGLGDGVGNGTGSGVDGVPPPPLRPVGVTQGLKIISKPRPGYTDAARQANVQGTVLLRVVFLASGQIGSISPVKGLPNGLTEQAIAAAHRIAFEPAKTNGIAQSVTKQIEYSFSIY